MVLCVNVILNEMPTTIIPGKMHTKVILSGMKWSEESPACDGVRFFGCASE
jgi:hypothetical protein